MTVFKHILIGVLMVISSTGLTSCLTDNGCGRILSEIYEPWSGRVVTYGVVEGGNVSIHPHGSSEMKLIMGRMDSNGPAIHAAQLAYWVDGEEVIETYHANGRDEVESEDLLGR